MGRKRTGCIERRSGKWFGRLPPLPDGTRPRIELGLIGQMTEARARDKLAARVEYARKNPQELLPDATTRSRMSVRAFGEAWTSGELLRSYGAVNGLRTKKSVAKDRQRLRKVVYPVIGSIPIADVTDAHIDRVMARIPPGSRAATQQKYYLVLHRMFDLAIVPGRLRKDNPVTAYHRPRRDTAKLFAYLYPDELLALLRCTAVPVERRVLYALAVYTGLRKQSLYALTWYMVDFGHGTLTSLVSKTGLAQMFEVSSGVQWMLRRWRATSPHSRDADYIVRCPHKRDDEAFRLRSDLQLAGVDRRSLYERTPNVEPLRFHDLRATFVTWAKRAGHGDGWISDRTGHLSAQMIDRYNRAARTLADLKIDPFPSLVGAIPELCEPSRETSRDVDRGDHGGGTGER